MKQAFLPTPAPARRAKLRTAPPTGRKNAPHLRLFSVKSISPARKVEEETAWDTAAMLRRLSSRFPNLDARLLGWVLLAAKLRLPPGESPAAALEDAEHLIRSDLFDGFTRPVS
jgi:hypothetical protein